MTSLRTSAPGVLDDGLHDRREARQGAGAEIVAVAEAAGQDDDVGAAEVAVLVPQVAQLGLRSEHLVDDPSKVAVAPRPGEDHDAKLQAVDVSSTRSSSKRKSSITPLASSCWHMPSTRRRAAPSVSAASVTSTYLPTRTSSTSPKPSRRSPWATVSPCGSLTTGLGVTTM